MSEIKWVSFRINEGAIITKTDRSLLLRMPNGSKYDGYRFWVSRKLVKDGNEVFFHPSFRIKIFKTEKRGGEWVVTDEKEIGSEFFNSVRYDGDASVHYVEIVPKRLYPLDHPKADESLLR